MKKSKDYSILLLLLLLAFAVFVSSCSNSSASSRVADHDKVIKARLKEAYITVGGHYKEMDGITLRYISRGYQVGDVISLSGNTYVIQSFITDSDECPYEMGECPNPDCSNYHANTLLRDYQIELFMDTVSVYDGRRLVGKYRTNWKNQIDRILLRDNE